MNMTRKVSLEVISNTSRSETHGLDHCREHFGYDPAQWHQAIGIARQACARIFRDGGTATDAIRAFRLEPGAQPTDWAGAVDRIAESLCAVRIKRAA